MSLTTKFARVSCAGCGELFKWRSIAKLSERLRQHCCWNPPPKPFKTYNDLYGEPDPDWRAERG